jgi:hypothetical protein
MGFFGSPFAVSDEPMAFRCRKGGGVRHIMSGMLRTSVLLIHNLTL